MILQFMDCSVAEIPLRLCSIIPEGISFFEQFLSRLALAYLGAMADSLYYFLVYKPYGMLSQFSPADGHPGLGDLAEFPKDVYPVGRLDHDSEGLLLLTNDKKLNNLLLNPRFAHERTYWAQVDGEVTEEAITALQKGVSFKAKGKEHKSLPARAQKLAAPSIPERDPPIRYRANIPTSWLSLSITEGKNRQVRKMTAAVGFPTLRLVRAAIVDLKIGGMQAGEVVSLSRKLVYAKLKLSDQPQQGFRSRRRSR